MRHTWIFVFYLLLINVTLFGQNQNSAVSGVEIDAQQNKKGFNQILKKLTQNYSVEFAYDSDLSPDKIGSDFDKSNSLEESLTKLFELSAIEFQILENGKVLLRSTPDNTLNTSTKAQAIDESTGLGLPYALITDSRNHHSYADSNGFFHFSMSNLGTNDSIEVSFLGFKTKKLPIAIVASTNQIELEAKLFEIATINIVSPLPKIKSSQLIKLESRDLLNPVSGIAGKDILRSIQLLPGIASYNDLSAQVQIRGSEAYETMMILDGIVIYNPTHFYNIFSAINSDFVALTQVYKNNLPIEFAGRTGGLVQMNSKPLNQAEFSLNTDFDLLNSALNIEIPVTDRIGMLISARSSYTDLSNTSFFETLSLNNSNNNASVSGQRELVQKLDPTFNYYDINAKIQGTFKNKQQLDLNFYYSNDNFENLKHIDRSPIKSLSKYELDYSDLSNWHNIGLSSNYSFSPSPKIDSKLKFNYSQTYFAESFSYYNFIKNAYSTRSLSYSNSLNNQFTDMHINLNNRWRIDKNKLLIFGFETAIYKAESNIMADSLLIFNEALKEIPVSIYAEIQASYNRFLFSFGSRFFYLSQYKEMMADPRLSLDYRLGNGKKFYGSLSLNHQYLYQFSYENRLGQNLAFWTLANGDIPVMGSINTMLGFSYKKGSFSLTGEIYQKNRTGIVEFALLKPGLPENDMSHPKIEEYRIFKGTGKIIGLDLLITRSFGPFTTRLAYTLSSNRVKFDNIFGGNPYPAQDDRRHQLKWTNAVTYKNWTLNMNLIYNSGKPYFDISNLSRDRSRMDLMKEESIKYLPYYFRADIGIQYKMIVYAKNIALGLSVFNLSNRQNVNDIQFIRPLPTNGHAAPDFLSVGTETALLDRTFNATLSIDF